MSQCDNEGAWGFRRGGGRAMKNARCRKNASCRANTRYRKYGVLEVGGKLGCATCNGGPRTPRPCAMTTHCPGNRPYLFPSSSEMLGFPRESRVLCPIGNGFCQPAIYSRTSSLRNSSIFLKTSLEFLIFAKPLSVLNNLYPPTLLPFPQDLADLLS